MFGASSFGEGTFGGAESTDSVIFVSADLAATYEVAAFVHADLAGAFGIGTLVGANLAAAYSINTLVFADLAASYEIDAPDAGFRSVAYTLTSRTGEPQIGLTGLRWALFAQIDPADFTAPVARGGLASTNAAAVLEIQVPANAVPAGQYMLMLANADTSATLASVVTVA